MGVQRVRDEEDPTISVVIPSLPGRDPGPTLARLDEQTIDASYEVLLVVDDALDRSEARNRGLEAARADVVALTDDDTQPPSNWLEVARRAFDADPALVLLEGPVYGGARCFRPRHYVGCNLAADRSEALRVGGFRSAFSSWREDVEFGWRMEAEADGVCRYHEDFRMCHPRVPRTDLKLDLERRLRAEYPDRYAEVLEDEPWRGVYRRARAAGITQPLQRLRNVIRFRNRNPCEPPERLE